ncbi:zinc transporter 1 [Neodiprion virginianus]|uniref:zinc transporter 1 n=1 Tax=Neodiprion fabricii TaxID=2872261 RepID=UPI001ED95B0A|nr:zinc transporter 1 [Neodiprion fabricii]XP_046431655.1 zinc transporter 1 [Neodiprion fabricii]XP_046431656.1 zinc transporter 1 [Neodiprion fabricii]XP_046431657.1 zinc transporter 1 [Neodiprion fabricii]XP_046625343.1 zinc transporter 1 [Neodiprion virginianus]XP_046625344.1 zinc transporter 1 [Neodiprion virginianus]XP_046625345.1 zinc transporter 1 [Neodiprion virginianus]XP_046625346.1 zinc transporter 1 [Neodiprion virginianus]
MGRYTGKKCRLLTMLWLTFIFFLVEIGFGYFTNSMALIADSFHMLSDGLALVVAFLSVKMSPKKWSKNTFGWARAEVLGALVNAVFLVALCFSITVEAFGRFIEPEEIHEPELLVVVGVTGLLVNVVGLCLFHEHGSSHGHAHGISRSHNRLSTLVGTDDNENEGQCRPPTPPVKRAHGHSHDAGQMNMRGVFLHVLSDALGSVIVIVSALVVWLTNWSFKRYIDPALSLLLVILILKSVWPLLRESALILLQTVPTHIQVDAIQQRLLDNVDGVLAVHEFHVWQLAGERIIASAHIRCRNLSEYMKIAEQVKEFFHNEGIHSTTIQPEFIDYHDNSAVQETPTEDCVLDCPKTDKPCNQATCCGPSKQGRETPSPGETPYMCRQRNSLARSNVAIEGMEQQEVNEMERGHLLSLPTPHHSVNLPYPLVNSPQA